MSEARYPEDEFDRIGKNLPQGAHRPGQPWWHGYLPLVIVIIAAPLLAWAMLLLIGSHPSEANNAEATATSQAPNTDPTQSPANTTEATGEPIESESATPTPEKPKEADKTVSVAVLNATGINGLAAKQQAKIEDDGITNVSATNFTGTKPAVNTIYYPSDLEAEAKAVQEIMGIDMIVPKESVAGVQVVLVKSL